MPRLENIERFKDVLNSLGNEPQILAERSEAIEEPALPEEELLSDLSDLFGEKQETQEEAGPVNEEETSEPETVEETGGESGPLSETADELPELDFDTLFGEEESGAPETPPEVEVTPPEAEEIPPEAEAAIPDEFVLPEGDEKEGTEEPAPEEEEFALPEELSEMVEEETATGEEFAIPEEFAVPEEEETAVPAVSAGEPSEEAAEESRQAEEQPAEIIREETLPESDEGEEEFLLDEFALPDFGDEFNGIKEEEKEEEQPVFPPVEEQPAFEEEAELSDEDYTITDEEYNTLKRTLSRLPINLKIPIEEYVAAGKITGKKLKDLLRLLVRGAPPSEIASFVSKLTGKKIILPRAFEKKAGEEFERERRTFAYAFRENILPVIKGVVISAAVLFLFAFLTYKFIYSPLHAVSLYRQGYAKIKSTEYTAANEDFSKARRIWKVKGWYYRYAEYFTKEKQFILAEEKYDQLLKDYPGDKKGLLDYAAMETNYMANYEKAEALLEKILDKNMYDYDALLASGDNYMAWGEEKPSMYEKARFSYASILEKYGDGRVPLFRMMRYFIKVDKYVQAEKLYLHLDADKKEKVDPEAYTELAGYFLDKNKLNYVPDILFRAMNVTKEMPEIHYQLARYYKKVGEPVDEKTALNTALQLLNREKFLNRNRLKMKIDTYNRLGEYYYRQNQVIRAEEDFRKALNLIESSQERKILGRDRQFGKVYNNLGDIYYYTDNNLDTARHLYALAELNSYKNTRLDYKIGYIDYIRKRNGFKDALLRFAKVLESSPENRNALYAMANTLYYRDDYSAAQGYYLQLLDLLETERSNIPVMEPSSNPEHRVLVEYLMRVYNNLGVTLNKLFKRSRNTEKYTGALVDLTQSSEFYDVLTRNPETMVRTKTRNLAFLNQDALLHPGSDFKPQIYWQIPKSIDMNRF